MSAALEIQQNVDPAVIAAAIGELRRTSKNEFDGWDFYPVEPSVRGGVSFRAPEYVRVVPVDGHFAYGAEIMVFTTNHVVVGSSLVQAGGASASLIGAVASALWSVR